MLTFCDLPSSLSVRQERGLSYTVDSITDVASAAREANNSIEGESGRILCYRVTGIQILGKGLADGFKSPVQVTSR